MLRSSIPSSPRNSPRAWHEKPIIKLNLSGEQLPSRKVKEYKTGFNVTVRRDFHTLKLDLLRNKEDFR